LTAQAGLKGLRYAISSQALTTENFSNIQRHTNDAVDYAARSSD
jgi:hypothetical protein